MSTADPKNTLCRYFANGACGRGDSCMYAHDWSKPSDQICRYYLKGNCAYGSGCRYDHVRPRQTPKPQIHDRPLPPSSQQKADMDRLRHTVQENMAASNRQNGVTAGSSELAPAPSAGVSASYAGKLKTYLNIDEIDDAQGRKLLCPFAAAGKCRFGAKCSYLHGYVCPFCEKACLHPHKPETHEAHMLECERQQLHRVDRDAKLHNSGGLECGICLDVVLDKPERSDRRFGVLPGCDHVFCLSCIRKWRTEASCDAVVRCCPLCRTLSYFVMPSTYWPATPEEKEEIMAEYKANLRKKPCKHFAYGEGTCPFSTSCFYLHSYPDGTVAEVQLRKVADADGAVRMHSAAKLWDFFAVREALEQDHAQHQ